MNKESSDHSLLNWHVVSHLISSGIGAGAAYYLWNGADWLVQQLNPNLADGPRRGISWFLLVLVAISTLIALRTLTNREAKTKLRTLEESSRTQIQLLHSKLDALEGQNRILREICGLRDIAEFLHDSDYEPKKLLQKRNILHLDVLGNGCSKWTREDATLGDILRQIAGRNGGQARFIVRDPKKLIELGHREKAVSNANSLLKLRNISKNLNGVVKLRIYTHVPAFRVTVINQHDEVIVGHYGGGLEDSKDTPLLVFENKSHSKWGLNTAFVNLFENEWDRAHEINQADWASIKQIAVMDTSTSSGVPHG